MRLYKTIHGIFVEESSRWYPLSEVDWDQLINRDRLLQWLTDQTRTMEPLPGSFARRPSDLLAPIGAQEVWAAGVTYYRSRDARIEESRDAGGGDFYDRVYYADRPELFFKSTPHRVAGHLQEVRIRKDSKWNVPEPELTLVINAQGRIIGYTIGDDVSSRDIEGENPLYLPQAKVYDRSCALGPGILLTDQPLPGYTEIKLEIVRHNEIAFVGSTRLSNMKRSPETLVHYLFRENSFPNGCFLLTGTGIVPPSTFTLEPNDEIQITIDPIGTLINKVQ